MKKTLLATTAIVLVAASASAVEVELYGQVNKGLFGFDDGLNNDVVVVDNAKSSTRFGLKGAQALDNGLTASVLLEAEMNSNASDAFTQSGAILGSNAQTPASAAAAGTNFKDRQARVGLSGNFGGVYLGMQSTAFDGVVMQDLAGAADVMDFAVQDIGGAAQFRGNTSTHTLSGISANTMVSGMDDSRANSIRYDSPIFNGVQGRASIAQGGDMDVGAYYDGGMGDFKVAGAVGAFFNNDANTVNANGINAYYGASLSAKHTSGLGATVAYLTGDREQKANGAEEGSTLYGKVGYTWDAFEVAADYSRNQHWRTAGVLLADDDMSSMGLAGQYNLADGVSVAALYRNFESDITATTHDDIALYGVNMKVKF